MISPYLYALILAAGAFLSGLVAIRVATGRRALSFFLVFTGGYLFSITIVHLFPEIYQSGISVFLIGSLVLVGFFIQQFLEFFSSGVEHGHIHEFDDHSTQGRFFAPAVIIALCVHSLLEGGILMHGNMQSIMLGILLHKIPAAFALVTILRYYAGSQSGIIIYLFIFSIASPIGMWLGTFMIEGWEIYLLSVVGGSFLQISTTIVFENNAEHKFNLIKLLFSFIGAIFAVLSEVFFF